MLYGDTLISNERDGSKMTNITNTNKTAEDILIEEINFYLTGVVVLVICILGILSNLVVMRVLLRRSMRSSTNVYLLSLAIFDVITLLGTIVNLCLPAMSKSYKEHVLKNVVYYVYPISLTAHTFTVWITVCFTMERYIAVCHPLKAISICTIKRARIAIAVVVIFSFVYNMPRWFEYETFDGALAWNQTLVNREVYKHIYYSGMYLIMMLALPVLLLAVFNTLLIIAVRKSIKQREAMRASDSKENNLTILLITVVLVFIICQTPPLIYNVAIQFKSDKLFGWKVLSIVRNFTVTLNSAINFVLYCALGEKFRKEFWLSVMEFCRCIKRQPQRTITRGIESTAMRKYTNGSTGKYTQVSIIDANENEEEAML